MDNDNMEVDTVQSDGEYTRFRMNIQRGEGVDRRGDVSIELVREKDGGGETVQYENKSVEVDHSAFTEFAFETDRSVKLLEDRLGLSKGED